MIQEIIALIIVFFAFIYTIYNVYKSFYLSVKKNRPFSCSGSCCSCVYKNVNTDFSTHKIISEK
ncbi:MAG: FeoB-associated Cys-rich membrane protein [Bacteroidales bacterium]|nr:FeoB-associated Cys-rich membrane protein [Bacteroidales bacterium]